jgi:hypothetical protein
VSSFFLRACLLEGSLLGVAIGLAWILGVDPWATWVMDGDAWLGSGLGLVPPLVMLFWLLRSTWAPVLSLRRRLDPWVRSCFGSWSVWELGVLAGVAGLSEEVLFRGVIQSALNGWLGSAAGLVLAATLFGLMHPISGLYIVLAGAMGVWFGLIWMWTGSLVAPVVAHGFYDWVALVAWVGGVRRGTADPP